MRETEMSEQKIRIEKDGQIAWMFFNRPHVKNAMQIDGWKLMDDLLAEVGEDRDIRAMILAGEGGTFIAGADLNDLKDMNAQLASREIDTSTLREMVRIAQSTAGRIRSLRFPVIAAVEGYAVGAGCEVAVGCDLVVAAENAKFGFPEVTMGACITNAGTYLLPRKIGLGRAKRLAFTGEFIDAKEGYRIGMVDDLAPAGKAREVAEKLARRIASRAPVVVQAHKAMLDRGLDSSFDAALYMEQESVLMSMLTDDLQEGSTAFFEKREPDFKGR
jgi:enoyl-CoA hydratase